MKKVGNDLWKSQIALLHEERPGVHVKDVEIELFYTLYNRMKDDYTQAQIRQHFQETFGIKHGAFYTRLRKAGMIYDI